MIMAYLNHLCNIENKVTILTGGGTLASEMASGFLQAGAKVIPQDIYEEHLDQKVKKLNGFCDQVLGLKCNVLDEDNLRQVNRMILDQNKKGIYPGQTPMSLYI